MKLPGFQYAIIKKSKLYDYLLSFSHSVGKFKAVYFTKVGYIQDNWQSFEHDIRRLISVYDAKKLQTNQYGQKYEVTGTLTGPNGQTCGIVTIWIIRTGESVPRLVTAYPEE